MNIIIQTVYLPNYFERLGEQALNQVPSCKLPLLTEGNWQSHKIILVGYGLGFYCEIILHLSPHTRLYN